MNDLLEIYNKNKKKHRLEEVTATGATGAFTGRSGNIIDQLFAGGFHPDFGEIEDLLYKQIEGNILKRMFTDDNTPLADRDFIDLDWKYEYDKEVKKDNSKFKSKDNTKMQFVDIEIKYDDVVDNTEENEKFINDTSDWKSIYDSKKY